MEEAKAVMREGFYFTPHGKKEEIKCRALMLLVSVDLQARAPLLSMTAPTSTIPCHRCLKAAIRVRSGGGTAPYFHFSNCLPNRDRCSFINDAILAAETKTVVSFSYLTDETGHS